ncbi:MAG: hypothetical protein ABL952_08080 [Pyrinomonadaceae bacterium]
MQLGDDDKGRPVDEALTLRTLFGGLPAEGLEKLGSIRSEIIAAMSKQYGSATGGSDEFEHIDLKGFLLERPELCFRLATAFSELYSDTVRSIGRHVYR